MAQTTFSGPVTSQNGFNSDDTLTAADYVAGSYNLTDFTVRPAATWTGTVAALVGAANSRTAGVSGGTIIGCYAQTSLGTATSTITGFNAAVYGVVDVGPSTSIGATYGGVFDMAQFTGTRAATPTAFIGFGEESSATNPCLNLLDVGRLGKNVASGASGNVLFTTVAPTTLSGSLRVKVNGLTRYIPLYSSQT